ncbi:MAG: hypothetical protein ACJ72O_15680 [Marmoricola sp.]
MKRMGIALAVGLALMGGGIAVVAATGSGSGGAPPRADQAATRHRQAPPRQAPKGDFLPIKDVGEPCDGARRVSSVAALVTSLPVWQPTGEHLTDAWTCGNVPVLMYGGVEVSIDNGYAKVDPATKFPRMVATDDGRVQTINGRLAYVHPADARGPRNGVWILAGDYSIHVLAKPEVGIDRVLQVASEIHIPASVG